MQDLKRFNVTWFDTCAWGHKEADVVAEDEAQVYRLVETVCPRPIRCRYGSKDTLVINSSDPYPVPFFLIPPEE